MTENVAPVEQSTDNAENTAIDQAVTETQTDNQTSVSQSWRDSLPDDLKGNASLEKFETVEGLAKSYTNLEKMLGADKVPVPKEGDNEALERWYKAGGWPEQPEGYKFEKPADIPEGMVYDQDIDNRLTGILHEAKLDPRQAHSVREKLIELVSEGTVENVNASKAQADAVEAERKTAEESLRKEWGNAFDERAKIAGRAMNELWGADLMSAFEAGGFGNHPVLVKKAYEMGTKLIGEKNLIGEKEAEQTPGDLDAAISEFRNKHATALMDKTHVDHARLTAEMTRLYEKRFPNG